MRTILTAVLLLSATAALAGEPGGRAPSPLPDNNSSMLPADTSQRMASPWKHNRLLGDALGDWMGVHNGRWDVFNVNLAEAGENGPKFVGTIHKGTAEIQLRWRPDE